MKAGMLKHLITFQKMGNAKNDFGEIEQGQYEDFKSVWASINPVNGKESFLANANYSTITHKIKIRYLPDLDASMQIVFKGRIFSIKYFTNFGELNKEIEILCEEKINGDNY